MTGTDHVMPASRLAAELAHSTAVRRSDIQFPNRIRLEVTDDGLSRTDLKTIREFGWMVSGFTMRFNSVSVVQQDHSPRTETARDGDSA